MIEGVIFDLDGTLIDSEPLWQEAEIELFEREGLKLTKTDCMQTKGLQPYDAVKHWHRKLINPGRSVHNLTVELCENVIKLIEKNGKLKEGVSEVLGFWSNKKIPMAIASASPMKLIEAVVEVNNLAKYFSVIYSGDFEKIGKPHPGIFISTAKHLKADPVFTVVFED
jgi:mannitol-1-/sugar-/sorbitol-6-/2-deoxyglucose-6-phosphatase